MRRRLGKSVSCISCQEMFLPYTETNKYCSLKCRSKEARKRHSIYIKEYRLDYRDKNRDELNLISKQYQTSEESRSKKRIYSKEYKRKLRENTFLAYGGISCACPHGNQVCGVNLIEWLTLDHINPATKQHNKGGHELYKQLEKENYPVGYRVLCYNCNCSRGHAGKCPLSTDAPIIVHQKHDYE